MSFKNLSKTIKYLDVNLTKHTQDLYVENDKSLMKENKEALNKQRYTVFKDAISSQLLPNLYPSNIFVGVNKIILKFIRGQK